MPDSDGESRRRSFNEAFEGMDQASISLVPTNSDAVLPRIHIVDINQKNPFMDHADNRIPDLKMSTLARPKNGKLDGYLKIQFCQNHLIEEPLRNCQLGVPLRLQLPRSARGLTVPNPGTGTNALVQQPLRIAPQSQVLPMPKDFGLGCKLNNIDHNLFNFCALRFHLR
jgi:hypothetical protein